jgi:cytochrome c oxidase assembly protein subunit 15
MNPHISRSYSAPLHWFALLTALTTLGLILVGGLVTSHGVGMAVPDWPNTYGYNMFLFPIQQWVGGILYEHSHRLVASFVGLLTTILAVWLWVRETRGRNRWLGVAAIFAVIVLMGVRIMPVYVALASVALPMIVLGFARARQNPGSLRWLGVVALSAVILQGVLGGLRVVWIQDELGVFHATLAQLFFFLICTLALLTNRWWLRTFPATGPGLSLPAVPFPVRSLLVVSTVLILAQLILGATMRHQHAGLAIPDFPLAYGSLMPDTSPEAVTLYNQRRLEVTSVKPITTMQIWLQMGHRALALGILAAVTWSFLATRRTLGKAHPVSRLAAVWVGLISVQVLLGAWTIWSNKAADIATLHVLTGALSLMLGGTLSVVAIRNREAGVPVPAADVSMERLQFAAQSTVPGQS